MTPQVFLKSLVNKLASRHGFRVERIVDLGEYELDIFGLLIELIGPRDPGFFFMQVGANDGQTGDPIRKLIERYHWRGVLIEPLPEAFARLAENYRGESQLILENAAVGAVDGTAQLWTVAGSSGILATFDRSSLRARVGGSARIVPVDVRVRSLRSIVEQHAINRIDLLQIDTEGFDYEIIKQALGGSLPRPRLIRYEHLHLSPKDRRACLDFLGSQGYRMVRHDIDTIAYRPTEVEGGVSLANGRGLP
jgi:FkbM family methyltransferase